MLYLQIHAQSFQNIHGALYLAVLFLGIINANSVQSVAFYQRSVLAVFCTAARQNPAAVIYAIGIFAGASFHLK